MLCSSRTNPKRGHICRYQLGETIDRKVAQLFYLLYPPAVYIQIMGYKKSSVYLLSVSACVLYGGFGGFVMDNLTCPSLLLFLSSLFPPYLSSLILFSVYVYIPYPPCYLQ